MLGGAERPPAPPRGLGRRTWLEVPWRVNADKTGTQAEETGPGRMLMAEPVPVCDGEGGLGHDFRRRFDVEDRRTGKKMIVFGLRRISFIFPTIPKFISHFSGLSHPPLLIPPTAKACSRNLPCIHRVS
jgi:hypothetical protein